MTTLINTINVQRFVHKILGELYDSLSELFDKLQEEIIGTCKLQSKPFPQMANQINNGFNKNEVRLVSKNTKNKGFFERFFQLFS